jgi:hypothetical protein
VLSLLFWARGTNDGWRQRLQLARHALTHAGAGHASPSAC